MNLLEKLQKKTTQSMMQLNKKILFVTTSRSEFGQFSLFLKELALQKRANLKLIVSGSHLFKKFGSSLNEIKSVRLKIAKLIKIKKFKEVNFLEIPFIFMKIIKSFKNIVQSEKPDFIILPCDRYEILIFAITSYFMKVPIIHFYGGEVSEGAIDNTVRKQVSLMSKYHFVSHNSHKNNLINLGINKNNIFNVGALSYERIKKFKKLSIDQIEKSLNIIIKKPVLLVTFHPVTLNNTNKEFNELLKALKSIKNFQIIFTGPNNDPGHLFIEEKIKIICKKNPKKFFHFPHLGERLYYSLINISYLVIGNSSSLFYEVPFFKKISLNIGTRQKGRMQGDSVINLKANSFIIKKKIESIHKKKFVFRNPYFQKNSLKKVIKIFKKIILS